MAFLAPTEEQVDLRSTLQTYFAQRWPEAEMRRAAEADERTQSELWTSMARDLGLHGLAIPEELGGGGFTFPDLLVVFEEMGRVLVSGPFFATVAMAAPLLLALDDREVQELLLPGIASGERVVTVALVESEMSWDADLIRAVATGSGAERKLTGHKFFVLDGCLADTLLVVAKVDEGIGVLVVDADAPGVTITAMETIDATRRQARVSFDDVASRMLRPGHSAADAVAHMCQLASIALAAEQVGGAQRALDMTVEYVKLREQFGRTIGSFQAVKHHLADLLVAVESARAALAHAAASSTASPADLAIAASVAQSLCSEVYSAAADSTIHLHGGIGFTWEHPAHLYYRRAVSSEVLLGSPHHHRAKIASHLLDEKESS
ncbi:acyl-CoA dehydrogenase family protein [Aeromicrobium panaciterrae]|uniref:acyl-CoA dehydrogenase family protein n=1 Tax=Aeromicrobium panaciterrae TaxID=363861 RepID=UPI0031E120B9